VEPPAWEVMTRIELIQERRGDGTIVLRAVALGPLDRLRRFLRRLTRGLR
jgi:DNA-binding GntR family transcriptional regulator